MGFGFVKIVDNVFGESFPAMVAMAAGAVGLDGKSIVKEEDALLCPAREIAVGGNRSAKVGVDFFEDVLEARWGLDVFIDRESEAVGLAWTVVRVLTDDDDFDCFEVSLKGGKNLRLGRVNSFFGVGLLEEGGEGFEISLLKFGFKKGAPRRVVR